MIYKFALLLKKGCIPFGLAALIKVVTLAATAGKYCIVTLQLRHRNWVLLLLLLFFLSYTILYCYFEFKLYYLKNLVKLLFEHIVLLKID